MKIGIQTWGSNGDIRPMLALGGGLVKAGHQVSLIVSSVDNHNYQTVAVQLGLQYRQIPDHIAFDMQDFAQRTFKMTSVQWLRALLDDAFFPIEEQMYQAAQQLARENDCLIGHHFLYPLKLAAQLYNKPFYSVTFCHAAIPNQAQAALGWPNLGKGFIQFSWQLLDTAFNWYFEKPLTRLWRSAGQKPPQRLLTELLTSTELNLVAVDPVFCQANTLNQPHNQVCGFLNLSEDSQHWAPPSSLTEFIAAGSAPVYLTFGSLQQAVPDWSMALFIDAVTKAGCRAIIQTSSTDYPAGHFTEQFYFIGKHPHQPVFKQCAAVVHHGGAGTTQAATRAGCPSVVVPFMSEQLFWAEQLQKHGLAGKPLPAAKIKAQHLASAIRKTLDNIEQKEKAAVFSQAMQQHNGVLQAVEMIEHCYAVKTKTNSDS